MDSETQPTVKDKYEASSVSHTLKLEWKVPLDPFRNSHSTVRPMPEIFDPLEIDDSLEVVQISKVIKFDNPEMHPFVLVLLVRPRDWTLILRLVSVKSASVKLDYAFSCIGESLYSLELADKSPPAYLKGLELNSAIVQSRIEEVEHLTIVCGIRGASDVSPKQSSNELVYECSLKEVDEVKHVNQSWSTSASSTGPEANDKYSFSGTLPTLDVHLAKDLLVYIVENGIRESIELQVLCVEYLLGHLDPGNVVGVLKVACELRHMGLMSRCYEFMEEKCSVVLKKK